MYLVILILVIMLIARRAQTTASATESSAGSSAQADASKADRKGKRRASTPLSPLTDIEGASNIAAESDAAADALPPPKRTRRSTRGKAVQTADDEVPAAAATLEKGKGKAKAPVKGKKAAGSMPRKNSTWVY